MLKLIVGLGNPTPKYVNTRHNIGFLVVDRFLQSQNYTSKSFDLGELYCLEDSSLTGHKVLILKPNTFMNRSGLAVAKVINYYKIPVQQVLVVHDDLDLKFGCLKLKVNGGSAGHNGLKSIVQAIGRKDFLRLRIGIGRPVYGEEISSYVLSSFYPEQKENLAQTLDQAVKAIKLCLSQDVQHAQNIINAKNKK